jgi:hypothetical protein
LHFFKWGVLENRELVTPHKNFAELRASMCQVWAAQYEEFATDGGGCIEWGLSYHHKYNYSPLFGVAKSLV